MVFQYQNVVVEQQIAPFVSSDPIFEDFAAGWRCYPRGSGDAEMMTNLLLNKIR